MNDLNVFVSHALSAVRDAQQSAREGDALAGEDAQPLLPGFADVMQGLIALAQTAPQTEDTFETAQAAMLQNLLATEDEDEAPPLDLAAQDAENEDGAAEILLEEWETLDTVTQDPLTLAFAPLQETIASLLLGQAQAANAPQGVAANTAALPLVAADGANATAAAQTTLPLALGAQTWALPRGQDNAPKTFDIASTTPNPQASQALAPPSDGPVLQQNATSGIQGQAPATEPQPGPTTAPRSGAEASQTAIAPDALQESAQPVAASSAFGQAAITRATVAQIDTAQVGATREPQHAVGGQSPQTDAVQTTLPTSPSAVDTAPLAAQVDAAAAAPKPAESQPSSPTSDAAVASPAPAEMTQPAKPANAGLKEDPSKTSVAQTPAQPATRPTSTISERQVARHVQNYQQAMTEQAPTSVSAQPSAPAAAAQFAPAASVAATAVADPATPTAELQGVTLPNLPADLSNALAAGAKRVRIEIHPPALGSVEVGVHMRDGAVFVSMQAENANVAQHIERHLQDLRANLKEAGLSLGGFEMSSRGDAAGQHASHSGGTSQDRLWSDDMLQLAVEQGAGLVEEIATPPVPQHRPGGINVVA